MAWLREATTPLFHIPRLNHDEIMSTKPKKTWYSATRRLYWGGPRKSTPLAYFISRTPLYGHPIWSYPCFSDRITNMLTSKEAEHRIFLSSVQPRSVLLPLRLEKAKKKTYILQGLVEIRCLKNWSSSSSCMQGRQTIPWRCKMS
jgi:hypothetical protein